MKHLKKFALVLLTLTLLFTMTACGGATGGTTTTPSTPSTPSSPSTPSDTPSNSPTASEEAQVTSLINQKLSDLKLSLKYDYSLNEKGVAYLDFYLLTGDEQAAMEVAGINNDKYAMVVTTASYTVNDIATTFSSQIRLIVSNTGRTPKKIGYVSYVQPNGLILTIGLLEF